MEFEKAKELFKKNTETMAAYSHAMGVLSYDSETGCTEKFGGRPRQNLRRLK